MEPVQLQMLFIITEWFIYEDIGTIGSNNIDTLKTYIGNNTRPISESWEIELFFML